MPATHMLLLSLALALTVRAPLAQQPGPRAASKTRRNIVLILSDDHRFDFMSFLGKPKFLETPNLDRMAREGVHLANAFVSTSLCSPSRASILTGLYVHRHRVVDNQRPVPAGTVFFPSLLQQAGYATAFIGKWHMGHSDDRPRPGFDHWASFRGQGTYFDPVLNIDGKRRREKGYTGDVLTRAAVRWLQARRGKAKPFFLYLSYKAVHYPFVPAPRHAGRYRNAPVERPETMANTDQNYRSQPRWVRERRYGIHGIDHMETGGFDRDPVPSFDDLYRRYCETVHGLDENIGHVLDYLDQAGLAESTLVLYLGDNGFALGEHGFYDKRDAFEVSMRIPMLAWAPGWIAPGTRITEMVQNIDIAPTLLAAAGAAPQAAARMDGRSFLPLLRGRSVPWRDHILYEYYWEWNFPSTPTLFAIRTPRFKYVYAHGVWDDDGFYDLQSDPLERHNLIRVPAFADSIAKLRRQMFDELNASGPLLLPVRRPKGVRLGDRKLRR